MRNKSVKIILALTIVALAAGLCLAEFGAFSFPKDEIVVFENHQAGGKIAKVTNTYYKSGNGFMIKISEGNGDTTKIGVDKNFIPSSYKKTGRSGAVLEYASYGKSIMNIKIPAKNINKEIKLPSSYYDEYTLFYVFRKFPFGKKDGILLNIVYHDPGNIRVVKMAVKSKGIETIKIGAGKFKCYKLELGTVNPAEVALWPYKYYFWFTTDSNHHFVKFSGRERDASLITSELTIYKIGKKFIMKKSSADTSKADFASFPLSE